MRYIYNKNLEEIKNNYPSGYNKKTREKMMTEKFLKSKEKK